MSSESNARSPSSLSTGELIGEVMNQVSALVKAQIELATAEIRADVSAEIGAAKGLGVAALAGIAALNLLLVTVVLALALVMPAWLAGLIVTVALALTAVVAGAAGWRKRVRNPVRRTRQQLQEDVEWTKEKMA
jgi:uncharacterized membrane protein YqjE